MSLASGDIFAGYTVLGMLGSGGMGEVYLVQHPRLPRREALKVLPEAMTADAEFRERFKREAEIAATLYHPHIVEVHDRGEFEGQLWIAMDYVDGTNAAQLMRKRFPAGMPAGEVLSIVTDIAGALDYAHQRGLLHRDVKPANILLTNPEDGEQRILLADFGVARQLGDSSGITVTNLAVGTVAYAAPEQLMGSDIDGHADQYALAATAFHLLTGAPPFPHANAVAVISQHLSAAPPKLSDRRPELARLDGVMSRALAKEPADRFGQCREFADALGEAAGVSTGDRSPEALLTVDYPDDAELETKVASRGSASESASGQSAGATLVRRLAGRRNDGPSKTTGPRVAAGSSPPGPTRLRRGWILLGSLIGAVLLAFVGWLAVGMMVERHTARTSPPTGSPATGTSIPAAAPTTSASAAPPAPLDGAYQVDLNRAQQTFNDAPDPQPPNVTTRWAFRSSCTSSGCVASGIELDNNNHQMAGTAGGGHPIVLVFQNGAWKSEPQTMKFPCVGPNGTPAKETTTQVVSLQPQGHGPLRGTMTVTIDSNECGQAGGQIDIPAVVARIGDVPPGVTVPNPDTAVPAAPITTPTR